MSPWQILELSDSESKKTSIISQNHLSGFLSKKSFTLYVEMQLYIKVSFRFMLGTATGSSSESETIHIEGSAELDLVFIQCFLFCCILMGPFRFVRVRDDIIQVEPKELALVYSRT
jgi:hypothetical protein